MRTAVIRVRSVVAARTGVAAVAILAACGGGGDPVGGNAPGSIRGSVTDRSGAAVANAVVALTGTTPPERTASSGADGVYTFANVPPGAYTLTVTPPADYTDGTGSTVSVTVAGGAQADAPAIVLDRAPDAALFTHGNAVAYLPPEVGEYRVAIVFLPGLRDPATGNDLDSRPLVRGTAELQCSIWCDAEQRTEVRRRALELAGGHVALIGTTTLTDDPASHATLLQALSAFAAQSGHPELATVPILLVGHSMGGCAAYGFTRIHGARVAGFLTMKGACHDTGPASAAGGVPGYFLIGAQDAPYRRDNITAVFDAGRAAGAPWAVSTDPYDHAPLIDFDLMFDWIGAVLAARLPETPGAPLRPIAESAGWLGNRSTGAISTYACYGSARANASWLPSRATALHWQRMAGGTDVVSSC